MNTDPVAGVKLVIYKIIIAYLVIVNLAAFAAMGLDKRRAVSHRWRTPERRLIAYAALGGSVGSILGMLAFRHKTRHLKFTLGLPAILLAQVLVITAAVIVF